MVCNKQGVLPTTMTKWAYYTVEEVKNKISSRGMQRRHDCLATMLPQTLKTYILKVIILLLTSYLSDDWQLSQTLFFWSLFYFIVSMHLSPARNFQKENSQLRLSTTEGVFWNISSEIVTKLKHCLRFQIYESICSLVITSHYYEAKMHCTVT